MSSKIGAIIFMILLVLLLALLSWHEGIISINLNALMGSIWPIIRFVIEILMTVLLGKVLSTAFDRTRRT